MNESSAGLPSIRKRLASAVYEMFLLFAVVATVWFLPNLLIGQVFHITPPGWVLMAHLVLTLACYFFWYWRHGGQTLAMQTWKIQLVSISGGAPSWPQLMLRFVLAWPSILFLGAGLLWAVFDRDRQFMHDRFAGTRIVFRPSNR